MTDLISDESFVRWIKGEASQPEQQRWEAWLQEDRKNRELKRKAEMLFRHSVEPIKEDDAHVQLRSLNSRIDDEDPKKESWPGLRKEPRKSPNWGYRFSVAAAVAVLACVVSVLAIYYPEENSKAENAAPLFTTIEMDYGERGSLKISDGSTIQLNSNSSLRYSPEQFNSGRVEVWLEGEGYFDITHNPDGRQREFIVHTADSDVQVLGTEFNVNTRFQETSIVLVEGSVKVLLRDSTGGGSKEKVLKPGEQLMVTSSQDFVHRQVDVEAMTSWRKGVMQFSKTPLNDIIASVEAMYGVSLYVDEPLLLEKQVTGSIQNPDLQTLLKGLEKVLRLKIIKTEGEQYMLTEKSINNE